MKIKVSCEEVSRLLSEGLDAHLPTSERARLRLHLVYCKTCRSVDEQLQFIRRAMRLLDRSEPGPDAPRSSD